MALTDAAEGIVEEIEALARWERDILADLARTRRKREALTRALATLCDTLGPSAAQPVRLRLNGVAATLASGLRKGTHLTDKIEAAHAYFAATDGIVTVRRLQQFLAQHGLAPTDHTAATILARKARQGVVTRVARGRYMVNRDHRMITAAD